MNRNQFENKFKNLSISKSEMERKWRLIKEEEMALKIIQKPNSNVTHPTIGGSSSAITATTFVDPDYIDDDYME